MLKTNSIDEEGFTQSKHSSVAFPNVGNQWFPGTSDPLEPLVPKSNEFSLKNLGTSDSLESVVPWNHLIPSADEMTDRCPIGRYKASSLQNFYIEGRFQSLKTI